MGSTPFASTMRRVKNLLPRVVDFNNLYCAFLGASHAKREQPEVRELEYHLRPGLRKSPRG